MGEGYVENNGIRLWYEDLGDPTGVPIVLVMGANASAITWPASMLESLIAAGHRVVRFDNRDIGLSTHIDYASAPYSIDDMADDTVALLDALDIEAAHFVGASMGGMISQVVALRHPARVRSLTLLITSPGPDERLSPPSDQVLAIAARPADSDEELAQRGVDLFRALTGSRFPFDESAYRALAALDSERGTNPNSAHAMAVFSASSRVDELKAVNVPTLIVHGTEDPIFPYDHAEVLARSIAGSTLVTWEGVGHEVPEPLGTDLQAHILDNIAAS